MNSRILIKLMSHGPILKYLYFCWSTFQFTFHREPTTDPKLYEFSQFCVWVSLSKRTIYKDATDSHISELRKLYPKAAYHGDWILSDAPCSLTLKLKALMSHEDEKSEISGDVQLVGKTALSVPAHLFRLSGHAIHFRGAGICHLFVLIAETMAATSLKIFSHAHPSQELNGGRVWHQ